MTAGPAGFVADQPAPAGLDLGPTPHEIVAAGLAACTAQTLRLYAARKGWALGRVEVSVTSSTDAAADPPEHFERTISLDGELDEAQRARLLQIAEACPIHKLLTRGASVGTTLTGPPLPAA
ncbi:OsmC family peroxiredoxin [Phenylobacterium soli]|uniref:OsmC family peroxiredoxin n=2 Tax=Phenylobacterium soli TaxID=2170551 RepID=A0A328AIC9_9CAUL|nr:OsmC family peroxiredoxin [Phenylobacterium soli]